MKSICAFTAICEEDRDWIPQYLAEVERLALPFVVHLDRVSQRTANLLTEHPRCAGWTSQVDDDVEFDERHKQGSLDKVAALGFGWALAWDVDETFETDALAMLSEAIRLDTDCIDCRWLNLWGDAKHIRVDGPWPQGHRVKLLNLQNGRRWVFSHSITNGPKLVGRGETVAKSPLVCLHHGMMTAELRRQHKERWDRIYSTALRGDPNPYGFWREAIETEDAAITVRHGYFS